MLQVGDVAPDFVLPDLNGHTLSLAAARQRSRFVLLVFLRHLG